MNVLVLFIICVFFFFPLMTYVLFWYDTANGPYREELAAVSGGRAGRWILRGLVSSMLSHVVVIVAWPFSLIRALWEPDRNPPGSTPSVVLIHGLYHNASAWIFYRRWLRRSGYERIHQFNYNSLKHSFHEIAEDLDRWMTQGDRFAPGEQVFIVGHSLGGLLARACAAGNRGDPHQRPWQY